MRLFAKFHAFTNNRAGTSEDIGMDGLLKGIVCFLPSERSLNAFSLQFFLQHSAPSASQFKVHMAVLVS